MTWLSKDKGDGCLACNSCGIIFDWPGPRVAVLQAARAHGWHVFSGKLMGGKEVDNHLCEECISSPRSRLPKKPPMEGDQPLWD